MQRGAAELELAVLSLPVEDRARLARLLVESLEEDPEVEAAWEMEIARRVAAIEAGESALVPGDQVFAEARRLIDPP